ncbi:TonB-dependent receptor plug domain-containing protein [Shewanella intestini]|uniref:TonB-dependent receptor n=1 Tax=Shewanella intestini TaxID=2017544 RepID=A0ABS5HXH3_9GAMM|nr:MULTISPECIES: TonB-dependent receptor [Shewanella]MBR9726391.1 TonB-dependent receptor [Shewanella intestini]MRG35043.1 TonB-dependent receptor [Shewanella sp. XMDDZSB0408]
MKMNNTRAFSRNSISFAVSLALTGSLASFSASAADDVTVDDNVEKIAVVGSRAAPRSIGDSPVPIDIISAEEMRKSGNSDMLEMLKGSVPSLNVHSNPISDAASLVRPANLRGLSADSTLVLLNGKRRHRSSVITFLGGGINDGAHGPDISVIPSIALKQVEVLRDGAAAQYGSDAIAGVINFVLRDDMQGGSIEVKTGQYYEGDGDTTEVSGYVGMPLTQDGFANFSFQYKNADATSRSVQRPDAADFAVAGLPVDNPAQVWGSPEIKDDISLFANMGLDLDDHSQAYLFGNYSQRDVKGGFYYRNPHTRGGVYSNDGGATLLVGDLTPGPVGQVNEGLGMGDGIDCPVINITSDNVTTQDNYINGVQNNPNCFAFNEMIPQGFTPNFGGEITDASLVAGTKGEFQLDWLKGISYDFSGTFGSNASRYFIYQTVNASLGPDTPRDFSPGKAIQTEWSLNADFVKYVDFDLADDVSIAAGLEWHDETYEVVAGDEASFKVGPLTSQGFGIGSNGFPGYQPSAAGEFTRQNKAIYLDTSVPFTDDLLAEFAVRYEDYDSFGSTTNYKVAANWNILDDVAVRASYNTGFRAPTVGQSNVSNVQTNLEGGVLVDSALLPPTNPISQQLGGTDLTPEKSYSYTVGAVYSFDDFFLTLDYYNIEVEDRISQSKKIALTDADKQTLKDAGVPNVDGLAQVSFFTNDFDTTTQGVDVVANYTAELLAGDSAFSLAYNWNDTTVDRYSDITGDFKVARLEEDLPQHRATFTWGQTWDSIGMFTRLNYFGEYQGVHVDYDATAITASASVTVDMEISYFINDAFSVSIGAQNLFDQEAEKLAFEDQTGIPNNNWGGQYYETSPYGFNGGYYYGKVSYTF